MLLLFLLFDSLLPLFTLMFVFILLHGCCCCVVDLSCVFLVAGMVHQSLHMIIPNIYRLNMQVGPQTSQLANNKRKPANNTNNNNQIKPQNKEQQPQQTARTNKQTKNNNNKHKQHFLPLLC